MNMVIQVIMSMNKAYTCIIMEKVKMNLTIGIVVCINFIFE